MRYMNECQVIDAFVTYLERNVHPGIKVDRRPDKQKQGSHECEIDAIAGPFAIEHTSIDTHPNQRLNNSRFMKVIDGLEQELSCQLSFILRVRLDYDAITAEQYWTAKKEKLINQALRSWIIQDSSCLKDGHHVLNNIPGIPFPINVDKEATDSTGRLFFYRNEPNDTTLPNRVKELLDKKANKLAKYQACGKTTVLLIESYDAALMHESKLVTAIRDAYPNGLPSGVDTFWYAPNTSIVEPIKFKDITADLLADNYPTKPRWWEGIDNVTD